MTKILFRKSVLAAAALAISSFAGIDDALAMNVKFFGYELARRPG